MMQKIGIVGCGLWGQNLIRNFYELGALTHICDVNRDLLVQIESRYPGLKSTAHYSELLSSEELNAIVIATPAEYHLSMTEEALLAGKDVLVEKPLALSYGDGQRVVKVATATGAILMVGHLLEYHPAILKLRDLVHAGELGKIFYVYSNRLNLGRVRREENILWSFAPHDIAVILRLTGELPYEVTATGGAYLQPNVADVTVTNLLFENGVRAHIFVSWLHPFREHRLVVIGSSKMAVFSDAGERCGLTLYDKRIDWIQGQPVAHKGSSLEVVFDEVEPLRVECQHFLDCLADRRKPTTDGSNALRVLKVLEACHRSLQTAGEPVQLAKIGSDLMSL